MPQDGQVLAEKYHRSVSKPLTKSPIQRLEAAHRFLTNYVDTGDFASEAPYWIEQMRLAIRDIKKERKK